MQITGDLFIGSTRKSAAPYIKAINPATGAMLPGDFSSATVEDIDQAVKLATEAYASLLNTPLEKRAKFLETAADNILELGDGLLERAHQETGLPLARLTGERGRTVSQLKLFAAEIRDGAWMGLRIDPAQPNRQPLPRSDLRLRRLGLGPVAVFGASNFPLAFSVAGGDTAAAFAAGCPVIVKAHSAHPGTSELVAGAIAAAVATCGLHEGTFSMVSGSGNSIGQALVAHPGIKAVGFTGSRQGGLAIMQTAAARLEPIPVYAEMSAVNPVILLPGALKENADGLGEAYASSLSMGAGQFCTNPGLVLAIDTPELDRFVDAAAKAVSSTAAQTMLTPGISAAYKEGVDYLNSIPGVELVAEGPAGSEACAAQAALFIADVSVAVRHSGITEEVFGASSVLLRCKDEAALLAALQELEGQLTATLHMTEEDYPCAKKLVPVLEQLAGRLIANGWPTGVEVCHAMVHGGPFPATSDTRTTSVGTLAIERFLRPVCYQDFPDALLPTVLQGDGASGAVKRHDGAWKL